jgi:hypothetical protein
MAMLWHLSVQQAISKILKARLDKDVVKQASELLEGFRALLRMHNLRFSTKSTASRKAIWLLLSDALGSLRDAVHAIETKRYRIAATLFRTADETMALAAYFSSGTSKSEKDLHRWYQNMVIKQERVRQWLEASESHEAAMASKKNYRILSRLAHRTYLSIMHGAALAPKSRLALVDFIDNRPITPIKTLAEYCGVLIWLISRFSDELIRTSMASSKAVRRVWIDVLADEALCTIRTKQGQRCQRYATAFGGRCWQHKHST